MLVEIRMVLKKKKNEILRGKKEYSKKCLFCLSTR